MGKSQGPQREHGSALRGQGNELKPRTTEPAAPLRSARPPGGLGDEPKRVLVNLDRAAEEHGREAGLFASAEFARKLVESLREAVLVLDPDTRVYSANPAFFELFDVSPEATLGRPLCELGNGQWNIPELQRLLGEILPRQRRLDDYEVEQEFEGIGWRRMSLSARGLDHLDLILVTVCDRTVSGRIGQGLHHSKARFRSMTEGLPLMVWMHDAQGRQQLANRALREYLGLSTEEPLSREEWRSSLHPEDAEGYLAELRACLHDRGPFHRRVRMRRHDGAWRWIESRAQPHYSSHGEFLGFLGTGVDVTEQRRAELDVQQRLESAARLQRSQTVSELTSHIAHELNQPLGAMSMFADTARHMLNSPEPDLHSLGEALEQIRDQAQRAAETMRRLGGSLSQGRIEPQPLELEPLLRRTCRLIANQATEQGIQIGLEADPDLPPAMGVEVHVEQVVLNLLRNALEAITDAGMGEGRIAVEARRQNHSIRVSVRDSGPGVAPDDAARLFRALHSTKEYGLGVGLRISRKLIKAQGGRLWVEPGRPGGLFRFELPLAP